MADPSHPLIPEQQLAPDRALPELEREVLARWRQRDVFAKSLKRREGAPRWVFYEGPPTANGPPGAHHVLSRVFKDIYPRFQTMRGHYVERKGGWDCHGLPVEISVEQKLGITSKGQIESEVGIERFNRECRESVFAYVEEWNRLTERIGFWIDLDHAYRTMDEGYIESVWWALSELYRKGLLFEDHKVVPYCYRCQTALSSHEVALGYREITDRSIYVRLPLNLKGERTLSGTRPDGSKVEVTFEEGDELLIWTTTPWTLPGNLAVAVGPQIEYVRARVPDKPRLGSAAGRVVILAAERVAAVLGEGAEVLGASFPGSVLISAGEGGVRGGGVFYRGPIFPNGTRAGGAPVIAGDFVSTADGTGLVHIAPAFGAEDFEAARAADLPGSGASGRHDVLCPVRLDGTFDKRVSSIDGSRRYEGMKVRDEATTQALIDDLAAHDRLLYELPYAHSYPHCWRCDTPLIYLAKVSWYVRTSAKRQELLAANETVAWHPEHVKEGRFGEWLRGNVDWALSRERYWGTPLPIWRCERGHVKVIGSFAELEALSGTALEDHHRPYVDEVTFPCDDESGRAPLALAPGAEVGCPVPCGATMRRVPDVIDVWFDSGAMPFAQHHARSAKDPAFAERFPADFICEALDQTRGWFYSLLAISTLLFERAPYRNVLCLGLILDQEGQKMSKSRGNTVEPWEVIERYGADAFRWYLFTAKAPWEGYRFSIEAIGEQVRLFLRPLWNTLSFYALYARANAARLSSASAIGERSDLDRWILSRSAAVAEEVCARLESYDATSAGRALAQLLDDISNWYIRRSRRRFWDGEPAAFATLRSVLVIFAQCLAPFCPFIADELYERLGGELESVHLCDFPAGDALPERDRELERAMELVRSAVRLGLAARAGAKVKIRQPLAEALIVADPQERGAIEPHGELLCEELNVKRLRFLTGAQELGGYVVKPNYRTLGPRFGRSMPAVAQALAKLDPEQVAAALRAGERLAISVAGEAHELGAEDILLTLQAPEGFAVEREGARAVALDLHIDETLRAEGRCREIVRAVQNARRNAGLAVEERIELRLAGASELLAAADACSEYLSGETLALALQLDGDAVERFEHQEQVRIEGLELSIALRRAEAARS
ncbi:MAG TPA: isoleucine--tRNA ligase [Solirubrobacteraceae bacterium]|nr:isoleucine--tRNA ligase [Solirubrobacteraceae bacterium]